MKKQIRPAQPQWLADNYKKWATAWAKLQKKGGTFQWAWHPIHKVERVNKEITKILLDGMTQGHCSFCDAFPIETTGVTLEHFKPKSKYPLLAYTWNNLYPCCNKCQEKGDFYSWLLINPDNPRYDFWDYFIYEASSGMILVNEAEDKSHLDRARAFATIKIYGLNDHSRPEMRKRIYKQLLKADPADYKDYAYRFLMDF